MDHAPHFLAAVFPRWRCVGCAVTDLPIPLLGRPCAFGPGSAGFPAHRKPLLLAKLLSPVWGDEMWVRGSSHTSIQQQGQVCDLTHR